MLRTNSPTKKGVAMYGRTKNTTGCANCVNSSLKCNCDFTWDNDTAFSSLCGSTEVDGVSGRVMYMDLTRNPGSDRMGQELSERTIKGAFQLCVAQSCSIALLQETYLRNWFRRDPSLGKGYVLLRSVDGSDAELARASGGFPAWFALLIAAVLGAVCIGALLKMFMMPPKKKTQRSAMFPEPNMPPMMDMVEPSSQPRGYEGMQQEQSFERPGGYDERLPEHGTPLQMPGSPDSRLGGQEMYEQYVPQHQESNGRIDPMARDLGYAPQSQDPMYAQQGGGCQESARGSHGRPEPMWNPSAAFDRGGFHQPMQPPSWPPSTDQGFQNGMPQQPSFPGFSSDTRRSLLQPPQPSPFGMPENNSLLTQAMQMQQQLGEAGNAAINQMQMSALRGMQGGPQPQGMQTMPMQQGLMQSFPSAGMPMQQQPLSPLAGGGPPSLFDSIGQYQQPPSPGLYNNGKPPSPLYTGFGGEPLGLVGAYGAAGPSYVGAQAFGGAPTPLGSHLPPMQTGSYLPTMGGMMGSTPGVPGMPFNSYR